MPDLTRRGAALMLIGADAACLADTTGFAFIEVGYGRMADGAERPTPTMVPVATPQALANLSSTVTGQQSSITSSGSSITHLCSIVSDPGVFNSTLSSISSGLIYDEKIARIDDDQSI